MKPRVLSIALQVLGISIAGVSIALSDVGFTIHEDLKFSETARNLTLNLYRPETEGPVPCVIVIQGGGFFPQKGQRFKSFAEHLAKSGFAAALISYRGRPDAEYRETMADVRASVRYVRRESERYGIDPKRIGATGRSAGGTLAALLAVGDGGEGDEGIQAAVCFAGVFDFVARFTNEEQLALQARHETKKETNGDWIGTPFSSTDRDWLAASAISHVDAKDPPVLFLHSRNDATVPWQQSRDMHAAMVEAGVKSEVAIYETGGHGVNPKDASSLDDMVAFFRKHLS